MVTEKLSQYRYERGSGLSTNLCDIPAETGGLSGITSMTLALSELTDKTQWLLGVIDLPEQFNP